MKALKTKGLKLTLVTGVHAGASEILYIFKGKTWTPYSFCVEYAEYYEVAKWSWYIRIDKQTMQVTSNAKDVDTFQADNRYKAEIVNLKRAA